MAPKSLDCTPGPYRFFHSQFAKYVPIPKGTSLAGQIAIVTGSNAGLGFRCAETLLELGLSHLILGVRTVSKGEAAASKLQQIFPKASIEVWQVDMLSYQSVQSFATKCETLSRIDFVILNAGCFEMKFKLSPQGHESTFQVNYLSTVLLSFLLLPTLKKKAPAGKPGHLTIVNSGTSQIPTFPNAKNDPFLPYYDNEANFVLTSTYAYTKALAHFWILKLAERVSADDVVVNLVDPGLVKGTDLHRNGSFVMRAIASVFKFLLARSFEQGVSAYIDAAVLRGKESHGSYLMDWRIHPYNMVVYGPDGEAMKEKIWKETISEFSFVDIETILNSLSK
ncbi:hypothetical protein BGZ63DRAFT_354550 [Mariannaea sp. PMI_226]|nr:hypothetical protein BGZ63DRAFT_354550 [Mariannaea sp. PMI_226]